MVDVGWDDLAGEELADTVTLRNHGEHRLKDLTYPQRIYQLLIPADDDGDVKPLREFARN